ncbi:MAG: GNAT family N-acetyltransferase [Fimbriimonadales bacterium]
MIEIRPIKLSEADEFLALVCSVFELSYDRAKNVFRREPYFDIKRKWALFENGKIASCLTTVPLQFGQTSGVGIAGVATAAECRGRGYAEQLLKHSTKDSPMSLLFATDSRLYEKLGYQPLDTVISGTLPNDPAANWPQLSERHVKHRYGAWAADDTRRLMRDSKRWEYWSFSMKTPLAYEDEYVVFEGNRIREMTKWCGPVPGDSPVEWVGLSEMTDCLELPLINRKPVMTLMGNGIDFVPQMFMTDQF